MADFLSLPAIRLEVEGMRHAIVAVISQRNQDLLDLIDRTVEETIRDFDWRGHIESIAVGAIKGAVAESINGRALPHQRA